MVQEGVWKLLHLFFAFSYVGSLTVAEWNGRAARATHDWNQRALLLQIVNFSARVGGFGSLVLLGVFGNVLSIRLGYSMKSDPWMWWVNGLWIVSVLSMVFLVVANSGKLATISQSAAAGGSAEGYDRALARWRFGNVIQSVLYLALLALMVFRWRS
jgi:hypothetical protein